MKTIIALEKGRTGVRPFLLGLSVLVDRDGYGFRVA